MRCNIRYVTGLAKTISNHTFKWNSIYSWTLKLHSSTIQTHQAHGYRWPSLLLQVTFCWSYQTIKVHYTGPVKPVNCIIKDASGVDCIWLRFLYENQLYSDQSTSICHLDMHQSTRISYPRFAWGLLTKISWPL